MYADLHLHSVYSDGTETPDELIALAISNGIKIISITDHDAISAYKNITSINGDGITIIPGIEISTVLGHNYLHILGYYIDICSGKLISYIEQVSSEKTENTRINFENALNHNCFEYKWERVLELSKNQPRISGVHVVYSMQQDNVTIDGMGLWDMFHKYFWAESPDFIPTETKTAYDAVDIIKEAGGIPIIAHPKSVNNDVIIKDLINYGLQGLEVFHPIHTEFDIIKYNQLAEANNLFITGGTDWHGKNNGGEITKFGMCGLENNSYPILSAR